MTRFVVYDPTAPDTEATALVPHLDIPFRESRALVFSNYKQHAREVMLHIVDGLSKQFGVINLGHISRPTGTPASPELLDQVAGSCDWAIVGAGD